MSNTMKLQYLILMLLSISLAQGQEESAAVQELSMTGAQLALDVYLDESGRALIVGYAEESQLDELVFLTQSEHKFDNETRQLYALTNVLTSKQGDMWNLNFSIGGVYSDFSTIFYFSSSTAISKIEVSNELNYYISAGSESLELAVSGFNVAEPKILVSYRQSLEVQQKEALPNYLIPIVILLIVIVVILILAGVSRREKAEEEAAAVLEAEKQVEKKEIIVTSEMKKVMETLSENELRIVETLIREGGKATQAKLRRETAIAKSSLSGHLNALDRKRILKKREYGRTNIIELSNWFLSEKEEI